MDQSMTHAFDAGENTSQGWTGTDGEALRSLRLELVLEDPEVVDALSAVPEGRERSQYARTALKIGLLALGQAQGRIDADTVRNEGERLIESLKSRLDQAQGQIDRLLEKSLKDYFDLKDGRFSECVERLVRHDGDLERVMRAQTPQAAQSLSDTLAQASLVRIVP